MKKVITYGTFDVLHYGHINLLKRAKALGDYLIVGLSSDDFNNIKGKKSFYTYEQRKKILESIKYVDLVIPENNWEQKRNDILEFKADIFVMGNDWENKFNELKDICEVVYLPRTENVSSSNTKKSLNLS
ncbi:MAG: glycerol-3-phosphate cytidylyltransferase [Candidatus Gastranaerophilales bacterium]|nr:glycerol-3-phosphate cytidylyltransferase [Candidatus Gastranaerophilales bacterium]MCM1072560.1 glycerol-3-phosphate cytidylyltransferase [Bacteroides sp.]